MFTKFVGLGPTWHRAITQGAGPCKYHLSETSIDISQTSVRLLWWKWNWNIQNVKIFLKIKLREDPCEIYQVDLDVLKVKFWLRFQNFDYKNVCDTYIRNNDSCKKCFCNQFLCQIFKDRFRFLCSSWAAVRNHEHIFCKHVNLKTTRKSFRENSF